MKRSAFFFLGACVGLLGCGDDDGPLGPELEEVPAQFAQAVCGELVDCVGEELAPLFGGDQCEEQLVAQLEDQTFEELQGAIDGGRVRYHAENVEPCVTALGDLGCDVTGRRLGEIEGCEGVFEGSIDVGGDCDVDEACTGDAYCKRGDECPGTCTQRGKKDASCTEDDECKDGLACGGSGKCEVPGASGDVCGGGVAPACGLDLVCTGEDAATLRAGQCRPIDEVFTAKKGETCAPQTGVFCEPELACAAKRDGLAVTFTCVGRVGAGEDCSFGVPSQCPDDEYCDANITAGIVDGKCQPLPDVGDACAPVSPGLRNCAPALFCDTDMTCRAVARIGKSCENDDGCASGHCDKGTCEAPKACTP